VVSGQLEDSLRHEIESYIEGRLGGVKQEVAELQSQLNESLSRLLDRQTEVQLDGSVAASILEHLRAAHEEGIDLAAAESSRAKASSDMAIVKAAIAEIHEQKSQSEILKALVNWAASFAPRVAFFVIKGEQALGWRARGFQGTVGDDAIQEISFSVAAETVIGDAAKSGATWSGGPHSHSEDHMVLNSLGEEAPQRIVAVPLVVRNRTVAVLYADSAGLDSEAINLEALETLVRVSGMAVDLLATRSSTAKRAAPERQADEAPASQEPIGAYAPTLTYEETQAVVPEESEPEPRLVEPEPEPEPEPAEPEVVEAPVEAIVAQPEIVERQPEPFETPVAPVSSPISPQTDATPLGTRRRYGMDMELPVSVASEDERRLHNDARRFARLLVSEIKLYNEQKVMEGRSQQDLYQRLREYIDRSREMYDKRVKPEVARKYDYFHHELVSTLAEGDAATLGNAYPGATVSA
jgi:hypothetical protein